MLYWSRQQTRIAEQKKQIVKALMSLRKEQEPSVSTAIG
ncbi:hypothetical protein J463_3388 [Acinetobacter baumannii 1043794]|nr:hypothetical protein J527_3111 [Acinetobacter baumannii 1267820]EXC67895.1 hypothetical protein J463_3388 [Acinetobacter baumannii 1043794]EXD89153.1 hypothetical protein J462_2805 [Acinetobacter baumannii 972082]EXE92367.1 hypothetical protein J593_3277 [Acinetobacter baumannii 232184]EXF06459.1 hypothetical protein J600_3342 [Acinetobacter baumannii 268680]EXG99459.1 hypothetical protein J649_2225 [Acinetobacter baumannii 1064293_45]EYT15419.1 hypothetical protein J592_02820 [Acinetobact